MSMTELSIQIVKAGQEISFFFEELPPEVQMEMVKAGAKLMLNQATSKLTKAKIEEEGLTEAQVTEQAMALATKRLDELKAGKVKRTRVAGKGKIPAGVLQEAIRRKKIFLKTKIKAAGQRISDYTSKALTDAAKQLAMEDTEMLALVAAEVAKANELAKATDFDIHVLPIDPVKKAKNDAKRKKTAVPKELIPAFQAKPKAGVTLSN